MAFRQPEAPINPGSRPNEAQLVQLDEDTMASLDLFIETLETDAKGERMLVSQSPLHSESNFDIYAGLDDNAVSTPESLSKPCRADYRNQFLEPPGTRDSPQYSHRSQDCHFASPNQDPDCSDKDQEQCGRGERGSGVGNSPGFFSQYLLGEGDRGEDGGDRALEQHSSRAVDSSGLDKEQAAPSGLGQKEKGLLSPTREDYQRLLDKYTTLRANMLSLCYTAQREMERKLALIAQLRGEVKSGGPSADAKIGLPMPRKAVAHVLVQTEPSVSPPSKDTSPTMSTGKTAGVSSVSIQTVPAAVSATSAQTDMAMGSDQQVQTDCSTVSSSSSQTVSYPLRSAGVQTGHDLPSAVKNMSTQSSSTLMDSKSVQTDHADDCLGQDNADQANLSKATEEVATQSDSALTDSKLVQTADDDPLRQSNAEEARISKTTEEVSTQCFSTLMESSCTQTDCIDDELRQGSPEQHTSNAQVTGPVTSVKSSSEATASLPVGVKLPKSSETRLGSYFRSNSHEVSSSNTAQQAHTGGRKRRHSSSSVSAPDGYKRGRSSVAARQVSHVQSIGSDRTYTASTPRNNGTCMPEDLDTFSRIESETSFHTACSAIPEDSLAADLALSDDDDDDEEEEEEEQAKSRESLTGDVNSSEQYVTASSIGFGSMADVTGLQHVGIDADGEDTKGMDENRSSQCGNSCSNNECASLPPTIESPSDDHIFMESTVFKRPIPIPPAHGHNSKSPLSHSHPAESFTCDHREQPHLVLGPFKHVQGHEWKRKLLLWATYAHRRVSRRQEIDSIYYGNHTPQIYDWQIPGHCPESDRMCDKQSVEKCNDDELVQLELEACPRQLQRRQSCEERGDSTDVLCRERNDGMPEASMFSQQMSDGELDEIQQEQVCVDTDAEDNQQGHVQETVDRDACKSDPHQHSDKNSVSEGINCSGSYDSLLSGDKSSDSRSSAHKKKPRKKKRRKEHKSAERRSEKIDKRKRKNTDDDNEGNKGDASVIANFQEMGKDQQKLPNDVTEDLHQRTTEQPWGANHESGKGSKDALAKTNQLMSSTDSYAKSVPNTVIMPHPESFTQANSDSEASDKQSSIVAQNVESTLVSACDVQPVTLTDTHANGDSLVHSGKDDNSNSDAVNASDSNEEGSRGVTDTSDGNKLGPGFRSDRNSTEDLNDGDSDFSIHTDDSDTEDIFPQKVFDRTTSVQNSYLLQPSKSITKTNSSLSTSTSDGQCSDSELDDAMDISAGGGELPGNEVTLNLNPDSLNSASKQGKSRECEMSENPTKHKQPPFNPAATVAKEAVALAFSKLVTVADSTLKDADQGKDVHQTVLAAAQSQSCTGDGVVLDFPDQPAISLTGFQFPVTPEKQTHVNSSAEIRTPDGKLADRIFVSRNSPIWSPEKSSFNLINSESMDTCLYDKLLGVSLSSSAFSEYASISIPHPLNNKDSKESGKDVSNFQVQSLKTAPSITQGTAIVKEGNTGTQFQKSCAQQDTYSVTEPSKETELVMKDGHSDERIRNDDLSVVEKQTKSPERPPVSDDKTPLFGYPSFTTMLRGGTKISFQYKRRPDYLAPSSSSSASSVTASSSSSTTSTTSSSSSVPSEPSHLPSFATQSAERLKSCPEECFGEDTDSIGFHVANSVADGKRDQRPVKEKSDSICCEVSQPENNRIDDVSSSASNNQALGDSNSFEISSEKGDGHVASNGDSNAFAQKHGSEICSAASEEQEGNCIGVEQPGSENVSTVVVASGMAKSKSMAERELEEGEIDSSDSFRRCCDKAGNWKQAVPSVLETMEESLEEGEIRTADGATMDSTDMTSTIQVKSPQPTNSENAQFRDLRDLLQENRQYTQVSNHTGAGVRKNQKVKEASKQSSLSHVPRFCLQEQTSDGKSGEEKVIKKMKVSSTKDGVSLTTDADQKAQIRREKNRDQMEKVRRQIFSQQTACEDLPSKDSHTSTFQSYKIPKLNKKARGNKSSRAGADHSDDRKKEPAQARCSTRASRRWAGVPNSHPMYTSPAKLGTRPLLCTASTAMSLRHISAKSSIAHSDHMAASGAEVTLTEKHKEGDTGMVGKFGCMEVDDNVSAEGSTVHSAHMAAGGAEVTLTKKHKQGDTDMVDKFRAKEVDNRDLAEKSDSSEGEDTEVDLSDSDSDHSSSGSLTDPDLEGCCRTRRFIYYRNPYKDRPELEMSIEDEDEEKDDPEEDGESDDQGGQDSENHDGGDNAGSEYDDDDDQRQTDDINKGDRETDGEQDTQEQTDEEDPNPMQQHLYTQTQIDDNVIDSCADDDDLSNASEEESCCDANSEDEVSEMCTSGNTKPCHRESTWEQTVVSVSLSDGEIPDSSDDEHAENRKNQQSPNSAIVTTNSSAIDQVTSVHVGKDALVDCLSLDAFSNGEGHFLLEQSDVSMNESSHAVELSKAENSTNKRRTQSSVSSLSSGLSQASILDSVKTNTNTSLTRESDTISSGNNISCRLRTLSEITTGDSGNKNCKIQTDRKDKESKNSRLKTKPLRGRSGSPSRSDTQKHSSHCQDKDRPITQSRETHSSGSRQRSHSPCSSKENGRPTTRRCPSAEGCANSRERSTAAQSRHGSFTSISHPNRERSVEKMKLTSTHELGTCRCCEDRQVCSKNRSPSPRYRRGEARHPGSRYNRHRPSSPALRTSPPETRHCRGSGERHRSRSWSRDRGHTYSDVKGDRYLSAHASVRGCVTSGCPRTRESCSCDDCLQPHPRSCRCRRCHDDRRSRSPRRCNDSCCRRSQDTHKRGRPDYSRKRKRHGKL